MKTIFILSIVMSLTSCKSRGPADNTSDLQDSSTKRYLSRVADVLPLVGSWQFDDFLTPKTIERSECPSKIKIFETPKEHVADSDIPTGSPTIVIRKLDEGGKAEERAFSQRPDFYNVGGTKTCSSLKGGLTNKTLVCHETRLESEDDQRYLRLSHRVSITEKVGFPVPFVPAGSSEARQALTVTKGKLVYEYYIGDERMDMCVYKRIL